MYRNFRARDALTGIDEWSERGGRRASVESKRIFNVGRVVCFGRVGATLKDCYVASGRNVTGVTGGVTLGNALTAGDAFARHGAKSSKINPTLNPTFNPTNNHEKCI